MKTTLFSLGLLAAVILLDAAQANAAVCARGVRGAGCVSTRGAAVVSRPVGVRRGVVVRRRAY